MLRPSTIPAPAVATRPQEIAGVRVALWIAFAAVIGAGIATLALRLVGAW